VPPSAAGTPADLDVLLDGAETVAVVTPGARQPFDGIARVMQGILVQMVLTDPSALASVSGVEVRTLDLDDVPAMLALTQSTQPGPFERRTIGLGTYLGIHSERRLVAMGGERLKVPGFTEISAVCVAPEYRGRGYAASLIKILATSILARGETPFLHAISGNATAIALYQRLGFKPRARFNLNVFGKGSATQTKA
jgi:predicted GNAT family acetyltransferase